MHTASNTWGRLAPALFFISAIAYASGESTPAQPHLAGDIRSETTRIDVPLELPSRVLIYDGLKLGAVDPVMERSADRINNVVVTRVYDAESTGGSAADPISRVSRLDALTDGEWETIREQVGLLDKIAYLPSLLPVIMKHRDTLELTEDQVASFRHWRKTHYQEMVDLMNEIIQRRIALSKVSLKVGFSGDDLLAQQQEIFRLQEKLLRVRLSCRDKIIGTFSADQWDSLAFILEEYPRFAGLLND